MINYTFEIETVEASERKLDRKWTLEEMVDIEVEQELAKILEAEIEKELVAAGYGTKAERDQKIVNKIVKLMHDIDFENAKKAL